MPDPTLSPYVVRHSICNGRECLILWRRLERSFDAGARAYQTASGYWIVSRNRQPCDVARTGKEARAMLLDFATHLVA